MNIVEFAETFFKETLTMGLREPQKRILECDGRIIVARFGRRTGKTLTLVLKALHSAITDHNMIIAYITPTEQQTKLAFNMTKRLIEQNVIIKQCATGIRKKPMSISFANGSQINFLYTNCYRNRTSCTHGMHTDIILIDEADYIDDYNFDSILGLLADSPHVKIIAITTPTGREDSGFRRLHRYNDTVIFKYGTHECNPNWDDDMEHMMRNLYPENVYRREIEAEFD